MIADSDIERARSRFDVIAAEIALKRKGRDLVGLCPFHNEKSPSFYISPDKGFFHCFGCGAHGTAIDYVMRTRNMTFIQAASELLGLPPQRAKERAPSNELAKSYEVRDTAAEVAEILAGCGPITETTAAWLYLHMRGLRTRQPELLAHPNLYCHETRRPMQAMVAPIRNRDGVVTALQRFYLKPVVEFNGSACDPKDNRADLKVRKKSVGTMGDGAVQLAPAGRHLGFAEGVETACAAKRRFNLPVWASCGTARFGFPAHWRETRPAPGERARVWIPPDRPPPGCASHRVDERAPSFWVPACVEQLTIFGDHGFAGEACARHAAEWFTRNGLPASVAFPADGYDDFNSELLGVRS